MKLMGGINLPDYIVNINRLFKKSSNGAKKTEIWAEITDLKNATTMNKRIWWEDTNGVHHDETPSLPIEVRKAVDNAWLEKKRKW